jgi:hypothetical protein
MLAILKRTAKMSKPSDQSNGERLKHFEVSDVSPPILSDEWAKDEPIHLSCHRNEKRAQLRNL